ncbi:hypothetical protein DY926_06890 [Komagataeibacter melaceti]|uniref:Uncharacterized protein n=1 Tax=Komagataeibacter melaceti TaxID=2766577 RepID=A0A371Z1C9_9PROT|nr:hypothetical protein DY926_06890 [Komagataeibacter melaceti]
MVPTTFPPPRFFIHKPYQAPGSGPFRAGAPRFATHGRAGHITGPVGQGTSTIFPKSLPDV